MIPHETRIRGWVFLIAAFNIVFRLTCINTLGFHRDELLYFSLGQHPAAGYASVPPFTGFVAWFMIHLIGYSLLAARIVPILLSGALVICGAGIARDLGGGRYAQLLAATGMTVAPFALRSCTLFMPVCFDILFWTLIFWFAVRWINTKSDKYLLMIGLAAGIGLMNKYLILVGIAALAAAFALSPHRIIFRRNALYLALLIALVVFLPNIVWQIINHLPVLVHMRALHDSQLVHVSRASFFTDQLFMNSMAALLVLPGIFALLANRQMNPYRPLAVAALLVLALLAILQGKSYYTLGLYPMLMAVGGVWWEKKVKSVSRRILLPLVMVVFTLPLVPMGLPVFRPAKLESYFAFAKDRLGFDMPLRWETGRIHRLPQDYADMLGWDELAMITAKAYGQSGGGDSTMIYAENYGQAGAVMVLGKQYDLPEPICFAESFFYWFPRILPHEITRLIYINDDVGEDVQQLFAECREIGRIQNPLARECGTGVWLCTGPRSSFNRFWEERVPQITNPFGE